MDFDKVHGLSGNIIPKSSNHVDWNNPNLIHVYLLKVRLSALFMLTTLFS